MVMRPWLRAVLKVAVIAATMCSGLVVDKTTGQYGEERHAGGQGSKHKQGMDRAA
jgi:hypothetical protein